MALAPKKGASKVPSRLDRTRQKMRDDIGYAAKRMWQVLGLPEPTMVQLDILRLMAGQDPWGQYTPDQLARLIIEAFRGVGKSYLAAGYGVWSLDRDPHQQVMVVSASKVKADAFVQFAKRLITDTPEYRHLKPDPNKGQRDSAIMFDVGPCSPAQSASLSAFGIFSQITGGRADLIIGDDIETPNTSETQGMRDKLQERVKEFAAILKPGGRIMYLGTPQIEDSLYNAVLPQRGYVKRVWPALYPNDKQTTSYGAHLAPLVAQRREGRVGRVVEAERFTDEAMLKNQIEYGQAGFSLQFMLDTSLSDVERFPLKLKHLMVLDVDARQGPRTVTWAAGPEQVLEGVTYIAGMGGDRLHRPMAVHKQTLPYTQRIMAIDPSGTGGDETTYAIGLGLHGNIFVVEAAGFKEGYSEGTLKSLALAAKRWGVNEIILEKNFGDGMFAALLKPIMRREEYVCRIEEVHSSTQKERRICDTLEPVVLAHRLILSSDVVEYDHDSIQKYPPEERRHRSLLFQYTRITRERGALKRDDRLDALAILVARFEQVMAQDQEEKAEEERWEELLRYHQKYAFEAGLLGSDPEDSSTGGTTNFLESI